MNREISWERAQTPDGPWVPVTVSRVPKKALRKAARPNWGDKPIVAYRYFYRQVARQDKPGSATAR